MASIKRRGNSYQLTAYCGYDESGKQKKRTKTWKPAPDMTAKQAEKQAKIQAEIFESECRSRENFTDDLKLSDFCGEYLNDMKGILAERTHAYYVTVINSLIKPFFKEMKVREIKPVHVQRFVNMINNTGVAPSTVKRKLAVLKSILNLAVKRDIIDISPARAEKLTMPKVHTQEVEIFSRQEVTEILEKSANEPLQFRLLIHLAVITGARRGEILGLKFSDFDYGKCTMTVSRSAYKLSGEPVKTKAPKNNKDRKIAVTPEIIHMLRMLKIMQKSDGNDWIFTDKSGNLLNPQRITDGFRRFLKKNGLPVRKFHTLRHTSATLMLYGGVDIKQVQSRLGHGNIKTTQIYLHCLADADREAVGVLQKLLIKKSECGTNESDEETDVQEATS
ncbi:MAG: site-specific integrase [Ruminococcus sp.]|nr:site-specific integrase [Ruminococcus sp.]